MTVRYLIRLYRYVFRFDPATMVHRRAGPLTAPGMLSCPSFWCCSSACWRRACRSSWCSAICAAVLFAVTGQPLISIAQKIVDELNSTTLMALPLFVMAAAFMRRGGVAKALVDVATAGSARCAGRLAW